MFIVHLDLIPTVIFKNLELITIVKIAYLLVVRQLYISFTHIVILYFKIATPNHPNLQLFGIGIQKLTGEIDFFIIKVSTLDLNNYAFILRKCLIENYIFL